ncbi:MAG: di-heme oxidoredictase family protein, partial [Pseudomonadales bacterium]
LTMLVGVSSALNELDPTLSAGTFTIEKFDEGAFAEHGSVLTYQQVKTFMRGRHHFNQKWVQFPSLGGDWGLGPTFIADRCSACHVRAGRGSPPQAPDEQPFSLLVRLSVPGEGDNGAPKPHPDYGGQLQNRGLMGQDRDGTFLGERVYPEAEVFLDWEEHEVTFADGESVMLRKPIIRWGKLYFGPLGDEVMTSLRIAQPLPGLGLLEAVPEETLLAIAAAQNEQGINGRPNYVWDDINGREALGRFGWKANVPSVKQQIAAAFAEDLGVTSPVYLDMNCPKVQKDCAAQPPGNQPELIDSDWEQLEFWTLALAVPARRNVVDPLFKRGEILFAEAGCATCHVPELRTADKFDPLPQLAGQTFRTYTDLLMHDMGEGLADGRPDFKAGPRDWRTPPLWGLGVAQTVSGHEVTMLHDGRARNVTEAIFWHGGEAERARESFRAMSKSDREALLQFLDSI